MNYLIRKIKEEKYIQLLLGMGILYLVIFLGVSIQKGGTNFVDNRSSGPYIDNNYHFSIQFPIGYPAPTNKTIPFTVKNGQLGQLGWAVQLTSKKEEYRPLIGYITQPGIYNVSAVKYPEGTSVDIIAGKLVKPKYNLESILDSAVQGSLKESGTIANNISNYMFNNKYPARKFYGTRANFRSRWNYIIKNEHLIYMIVVVFPEDKAEFLDSQEVDNFINSFRLLEE